MIYFTQIFSDKWTKIGVDIGICLYSNQANFKLHRFTRRDNTAKSFRGGGTFLLSLYIDCGFSTRKACDADDIAVRCLSSPTMNMYQIRRSVPTATFQTLVVGLVHSHVSPTCRTDARSDPPPLNGLTFQPAVGQRSEVVLFLLPVQRCGTACQAMSHQLRRWRCSRTDSRRTCSAAATKLFDSE